MDEEKKKEEEIKEVEIVKEENAEEVKTEETVSETKGFSIASMVLGILSVVILCYWPIAIICSILAIIFGVIGRKKAGKGMATAGLVLGIVSICLFVLIVIFFIVLGTTVLLSAPEILEGLESLNTLNTL